MSQKEKYNDLMLAIKEDEAMSEEQNRVDATLEQIKEALALLQKLLEAIRETKESGELTQKGLEAATQSAENIITRICDAIVRVENTPFKARLDDESIQKLKELHDQWFGQEKQMLADHHWQQESNWQKHSQRLTDIVKHNKGVWMSEKVFYIVGTIGFLSTFAVLMYTSLWVYHHWIL